jgi:hypothetical protein
MRRVAQYLFGFSGKQVQKWNLWLNLLDFAFILQILSILTIFVTRSFIL